MKTHRRGAYVDDGTGMALDGPRARHVILAERFPHGLGLCVPLNLPNFITLGRIIAVPVVFWLLMIGQPKPAFIIFVLAGISDAVDGYLAKTYNWQTELGAYLDPLADKLLIVSIYVALGVRGELPLWLVVAVVSRDIAIVGAVMIAWLMDHPVRIKPLVVSKLNTAAQLTLASLVLFDEAFGFNLDKTRMVLVWVTGILTFASLAAYLRAWIRHMSSDTPPGGGPTT
jgi:cardiolipin synthase (CMP-forming)